LQRCLALPELKNIFTATGFLFHLPKHTSLFPGIIRAILSQISSTEEPSDFRKSLKGTSKFLPERRYCVLTVSKSFIPVQFVSH
jgi:hypothetical protein